ncbi:hypothetical protein FH972_014121 [Carpinus fangiana]|uniref:MLO-like protein n=1 Tax=Carpinus fangiana TaxID=176857 RepID=A0A5N6R937_9ROSI|nr:hypothetical protein FH972_014121 [Carpinus fangiana]
MAGGGEGATPARELDQTPTWAVAVVCAVIVMISIILEKVLHRVGEWFRERKKNALFEALEKIKGELMVLGFISLLLTFGQSYISRICIPVKAADTMLPCPLRDGSHYQETEPHNEPQKGEGEHHRKLLWYARRYLAAEGGGAACKPGLVPLISVNGLHQLHIFIFFLAVFHVIYSAITMMLGRLKIRGWKDWERDSINDPEFINDPTRFRLTHETSFVKDHNSFWTKSPVTFYFVCFFRQFFRSVRRADYLALRHGFITFTFLTLRLWDDNPSICPHFFLLAADSPLLWTSVVIFLLVNVSGWDAMVWVSILPLIVILAVGTKLQGIITNMALEIKERHAVVQGIPLVQVSDRHFWFSWPRLVLYLIHFVLFQNAFEITFFFWIWYEFGLRSCFHEDFALIIFRVVLGVGVQIVCSYITLPLYALVTQMGSTMKKSIFDEQTSKALKEWHKKAVKKKNDGRGPASPRALNGSSPGESPLQSPTHAHPRNHAPGAEADRSSPKQTADIMASVDLPRQRSMSKDGFRDLLSGP